MRNYETSKIIRENVKSDRENLRNKKKNNGKTVENKCFGRISLLFIDVSKSVGIMSKGSSKVF